MPISKRRENKVKVLVKADPATETFIIDTRRELRARGVGNFTTSQKPGEYKLKFRTGTTIQVGQQFITAGTASVTIEAPPQTFSSPAVFEGTTKTHEYHIASAGISSRQIHKRVGAGGSQLFIFTRAWTGRPATGFLERYNPANELSLHDLSGQLLVDLESEAVCNFPPVNPPFDPWAACNIEIDPGAYRLRLKTPNRGTLEQIVVASQNWQTQIFLLERPYVDFNKVQGEAFLADLPNAAILLSPIGNGFSPGNFSSLQGFTPIPGNADLRPGEIARIALEDRRSTIAEALLEEALSKDSLVENPMLGIYGAHALLSERKPNRQLLAKIVRKLRKVLGTHPDVEALSLFLNQQKGSVRWNYETPPMLRSSWSILVKSSSKNTNLVPYGSLSASIATHLWSDSIWLIWLMDKLETAQPINVVDSLEADLHAIWEISKGLAVDDTCGYPKALVTGELGLNNYEGVLLTYLTRDNSVRSKKKWSAKTLCSGIGGIQGRPTVEVLATALGVPPAAVQATTRSLLHKLNMGMSISRT